MIEKRKNSDKRSGMSLFLAAILVLAGLFTGLNLGNGSSDTVVEELQIYTVDLSGEWVGTTTQDYSDNMRYDYRVVIDQDGSVISGVTYLDMIGGREAYSEERIEGSVDGTTLFFEEVETLQLLNTDAEHWCLTQSTLTYQILNGQETLVGEWQVADWEREECGDISGRIILTRQAD